MVSTRNHPTNFPPPDMTPSKSSGAASPATPPSPSPTGGSPRKQQSSAVGTTTTPARKSILKAPSGAWTHATSPFILGWLVFSLPLLVWDVAYILLRPHTMPGGKWHWPIWVPYQNYYQVDYNYGFEAFEAGLGFVAATSAMNAIEALLYLAYLYYVARYSRAGAADARGGGSSSIKQNAPVGEWTAWFGKSMVVGGREGAIASILGFSSSLMTVSKTTMYFFYEYYSMSPSYAQTDLLTFIIFYIIVNGGWFVAAAYMNWVFLVELYQALLMAGGEPVSSNSKTLAIKDA